MKKQIKRLAALSAIAALSLASTFTSLAAGWQHDQRGWWYQNADGTYLVSQWLKSPESGKWYYFDEYGYMMTGSSTPDGYCVDGDGVWTGGPQDKSLIRK